MQERRRAILLLDLDGVVLDNERYEPEWERLAGRAFMPLLGGSADSWAEHQEAVWQEVSGRGVCELEEQSPLERPPPSEWWDRMNSEWIAETCERVGVRAPSTPRERIDVAERALAFYFRNTRGVFPGTADTIVRLSRGFEVHMASGNPASVVETVLERLGVREQVGFPFGSDLAGEYKQHSVPFYGEILSRIEAQPDPLIVVDDVDSALDAARELGAVTVKVGPASQGGEHDFLIETLAELPPLLESL